MKRADISIDQYDLEGEWLRQPGLVHQALNEYADAQRERDDAKEELDRIKWAVDERIREEIRESGDKKPTEAQITGMINRDQEVVQAQQTVADASDQVQRANAFVQALEHKRRALENIVKLKGMDWFSEPRASGQSAERAAETATRRAQGDELKDELKTPRARAGKRL